jgi:hypothetical protein
MQHFPKYNWWGTTNEDSIKARITSNIDYNPFLDEDLPKKALGNFGAIPDKLELSQAYPNPFNLQAKIDYAIPVASHVSIKIYNILGQEINELINQDIQPGYYSAIWGGTDKVGNPVSSGVYLYCLRTLDKVITKKMVMLK